VSRRAPRGSQRPGIFGSRNSTPNAKAISGPLALAAGAEPGGVARQDDLFRDERLHVVLPQVFTNSNFSSSDVLQPLHLHVQHHTEVCLQVRPSWKRDDLTQYFKAGGRRSVQDERELIHSLRVAPPRYGLPRETQPLLRKPNDMPSVDCW
jgi:hypothetical protein